MTSGQQNGFWPDDELIHLRAQAADAEQRYRDLFAHSPDILYTHDLHGRLVDLNPAGERITGYTRDEVVGKLFLRDLVHPDYLEAAVQQTRRLVTEGPASVTYEIDLRSKAGQPIPVEVTSYLVRRESQSFVIQGIATDLTGRRKLEDQLHQTQRREAVGVLAGGIAHDFNNLLTGILGYADLLKLGSRPGEQVYEAVSVIQNAAEQAVRLTRQLLSYARQTEPQQQPVDVHEAVSEVIGLLRRTIDKNIRIVAQLQAQPHAILGDAGQLHQVLLNLALNAKDAMPDGGTLTFHTSVAPATRDREAQLRLAVADTGCGIRPELQSRIFEPFFTTKPPDKGTGMGLAMVSGIVRRHQGTIDLASEVGRGTVFTLSFPLEANQVAAAPVAEAPPSRGKGRVLVVDDEEIVRRVASDMLGGLGYQVVLMPDGLQALDYYRSHADEIDLVLLDMVMPSMNGRDCFLALREINPGIRAVLTSGYGVDGAAQQILDLGMAGFIQKPFQMARLSDAVARALNAANAAK